MRRRRLLSALRFCPCGLVGADDLRDNYSLSRARSGFLVDLEGGPVVNPAGSGLAHPDPLQCVPELIDAGDLALSAPAEDPRDPPELHPCNDREDRPGQQQ